MTASNRIVIALGGNAIIKQYQRGTVPEQFANAREALKDVPQLVKDGHELIITHGNGPQVGNVLIRVEEAIHEAYELPLGVCVAETQGEMGYMIAQTVKNFFILEKIDKEVAAIITQVVVNPDHPSTFNPSKPIGPYLKPDQAEELKERNLPFVDDAGRGLRRIVPSPIPLKVVEGQTVRKLLDLGVLVVAAGGGGMPVYHDHRGCMEGVDAVVDKDLASSLLANEIGADMLVILTAEEKVALNYKKPDERLLDRMTVAQARDYADQGHFPPGSMGPKIDAAIRFLENGGKTVVISASEKLGAACRLEAGTTITLQ